MAKVWNIALPDPEGSKGEQEIFRMMSDTLYTYLISISKHNPGRYSDGTPVENWNYIYLDGDKDHPRYNAAEVQRILKISKSTYYRKMQILKKCNLIIEGKDKKGRRILMLPFQSSKTLVPVKTCAFFCQSKDKTYCPEDIIKLIVLLKIRYNSEQKYFTFRWLRIQLGYSPNHKDKDTQISTHLAILAGFDIVDWEAEQIYSGGQLKEIRYHITHFNDEFNSKMANFALDLDFEEINDLSEEELKAKLLLN